MQMGVNTELLGSVLSIQRNLHLYEKLRETYSQLAIIAHGWDHVHRCLVNAVMIGETEACCMDIVFASALLHDIGFIGNPDPVGHHERGAAACVNWLEEWSESERNAIRDCIYSHKGKSNGFRTTPSTIEQKIICDADLLEKVGYTGLFQSVVTYFEVGAKCWPQFRSLEQILRHLIAVDDLTFYTARARELSEERGGTALRRAIYAKALEELSTYYENARERSPDPFATIAAKHMGGMTR
jgi:HD superfamily phosphodiesterase